VRWYNVDHRHSGIRYVSPQQRHTGGDQAILAARHALYVQAHPGSTPNAVSSRLFCRDANEINDLATR
jgi:hypothetical protein